jgi:hypothetical protein
LAQAKEIINGSGESTPVLISRSVFLALSPLEQLAARALEKCGSVQIVEDAVVEAIG